EALVERVWGEDATDLLRQRLQMIVVNLRRVLGKDVLLTVQGGYVLRVEPEAIDAERCRLLTRAGTDALASRRLDEASTKLNEAVALWRGEALEDVRHEGFLNEESRRLEELRVAAVANRNDADLELGRHDALIPELRALVDGEHWDNQRLCQQL